MVDVGDPFQREELVHQQVAEQIYGAVGRIAEALNTAAVRSAEIGNFNYVENWSLVGEVVILWRTARAVLGSHGAY